MLTLTGHPLEHAEDMIPWGISTGGFPLKAGREEREIKWGKVAHACDASVWEAEAGGPGYTVSLRT